jgi:putative flippase GtrA
LKLTVERFHPDDRTLQFGRYLANGLAATVCHYLVLNFALHALKIPSFAASNFVGACAGIAASFVGNRYFVFRRYEEPLIKQCARFLLLYLVIAAIHTSVLFVWSDRFGWNYNVGFLIATCLQLLLSYLGNRILVFSK